jgi:DNA-binding MarR family transcriptional regulator
VSRTAPDAASPSAGTDVERLAEALARLTRNTRRILRLPIGASTLAALVTIADRGPIRLRDLAAHEGITPATLSRIVSALEEENCIIRQIDPGDRRSAFLQATEDGRAVLHRIRQDRVAALTGRFQQLTPEHQRALAAALAALEALAGE